MPTIANRSPYWVSVKNRPDLARRFPFTKRTEARTYLMTVRREHPKAVLTQGENKLLVRIRTRGHADVTFKATSYAEAEQAILRIESERRVGLFIDYSRAQKTTLAKLFETYIQEECPKHKGCAIETYTLKGFLADSRNELTEALAERERSLAAGLVAVTITARRIPRLGLKWLHKPLAQVLPVDVEEYIHDRLDQEINPATVDRELDLISQVLTWASKTLRIPLNPSPMYGVRRPKYFNERDRRLQEHTDEKNRLLAAAREEDRLQSLEKALEGHLATTRHEAARFKASTRTRRIAKARAAALQTIGNNVAVVPIFETLLEFLLATAARRSEALALLWTQTFLDAQTAFFPDTKNGRSRTVPLRRNLVELLDRLPRSADRVFPLSVDALKGAWYRICARARIEDLHLHDLRHEAISLIAEAGLIAGRPFSLRDLASITGHRDLRCLSRYTNLCASKLAIALDEVFAAAAARAQGNRNESARSAPTGLLQSQPAHVSPQLQETLA
jgi:integrase